MEKNSERKKKDLNFILIVVVAILLVVLIVVVFVIKSLYDNGKINSITKNNSRTNNYVLQNRNTDSSNYVRRSTRS